MRRIRLLIIPVLMVASLSMPSMVAAQQAAAPERLAAMRANCQFILQSLVQLQKRDLVARTNRGRAYEAAFKQMEAFTLRVKNNNLQTQAFDVPMQEFKTAVSNFRESYVRYDNSLNDLRNMGCQEKAPEFAAQLEVTRVMRAETAAAITKANEAMTRYRQSVAALQVPQGVSND